MESIMVPKEGQYIKQVQLFLGQQVIHVMTWHGNLC